MARYTYRCGEHGPHDVSAPIGTANDVEPCPVCRTPGSRMITSPMLSVANRGVTTAMDRAEKSADQPEVVRSLPAGATTRHTPVKKREAANPAWAGLPRP